MNLAELFVKIGLKGGAEVAKGLKSVNAGMETLESSSLATKAAIVGVFYGLERLTGFASQMGMDLQKFAVTTGLSTEELQKWQHAAMLFDVSGGEVASTIKGIQNAMTSMQLGGGMPEGFDVMARMVKLDPKRINDTFYVLSKVQEFIKKAPANVGNVLAKSLGISDDMFQALKMLNLKRDQGTSRDRLTKGEEIRLSAINRQWKEIWNTIKLIGAKLVAGNAFFATDNLLAFSRLLSDVATNFDKFKTVAIAAGIAIGATFAPITAAVTGLIYLMAQYQKFKEGSEDSIFAGKHISEEDTAKVRDKLHLDKMSGLGSSLMNPLGLFQKHEPKPEGKSGSTVNNTIHIDGAHSPEATGHAVVKAINSAVRKTPAVAGGY